MNNITSVSINQTDNRKLYLEILVMIFAFFFIYTGAYKLLNIDALRFNLARTGIYPDSWLVVLPYAIVALEFFVVGFLLFRKRIGIPLFASIMTFFTGYILYLFYTGRYEVCGCGGVLNGLEFEYHLGINISFIILSIIAMFNLKNTSK